MKKIFLVLSFILIFIFLFRHEKWDRYYKNKIGKPPCNVVIKVDEVFRDRGFAIDLGCGVGNDAIFLVNSGWKVLAIDSEQKAIQLIKNRCDIKNPENLNLMVARFDEELTWKKLPSADLIYASCSLPFCKRDKFKEVWNQIKQHLNSNGRFAGHFFGTNYKGFKNQEMVEMTFLKREEVLELFEDFEIEFFQEVEEDGQSGTGRSIHSHIFEVIARKRK